MKIQKTMQTNLCGSGKAEFIAAIENANDAIRRGSTTFYDSGKCYRELVYYIYASNITESGKWDNSEEKPFSCFVNEMREYADPMKDEDCFVISVLISKFKS